MTIPMTLFAGRAVLLPVTADSGFVGTLLRQPRTAGPWALVHSARQTGLPFGATMFERAEGVTA